MHSAVALKSELLLSDTKLVVIDTETAPNFSRTNPQTAVIELAVVLMDVHSGTIEARYRTYVKPDHPIPDQVSRALGITNEMVENAPRISDVIEAPDFMQIVNSGALLVGHNLSYDLRSILESLARSTSLTQEQLKNRYALFSLPEIDTLKIARRLLSNDTDSNRGDRDANKKKSRRHRLKDIALNLGIKIQEDELHSALYDAELTAVIATQFIEQLRNDYFVHTYGDLLKFLQRSRSKGQLSLF